MHASHRASGQASIEYVAAVALVALVFSGTGAVVASPDLRSTLLGNLRVAVCAVEGDICRTADARAAGLDPCVVTAEGREKSTSAGAVVLRTAQGQAHSVELRSDGSVLVQSLADRDLELTADASVRLGPFVDVGARGSHGVRFRSGRAWELPDMAAARRLLASVPSAYALSDDTAAGYLGVPRAPIRYRSGGPIGSLDLSAELGPDDARTALDGLVGESREQIGTRTGPDGTTRYVAFEGSAHGLLARLLPDMGRGGTWTAEWTESRPPVVTIRRTTPGPRAGQISETVARAVLTDPDDIAAAKRFVLFRHVPAVAFALGRRLAQRVESGGWVERRVYSDKRDSGGFDASLLGLGVEHRTASFSRRLVSATVLSGAAAGAERRDCTGV